MRLTLQVANLLNIDSSSSFLIQGGQTLVPVPGSS